MEQTSKCFSKKNNKILCPLCPWQFKPNMALNTKSNQVGAMINNSKAICNLSSIDIIPVVLDA